MAKKKTSSKNHSLNEILARHVRLLKLWDGLWLLPGMVTSVSAMKAENAAGVVREPGVLVTVAGGVCHVMPCATFESAKSEVNRIAELVNSAGGSASKKPNEKSTKPGESQ